METYSSPRRAAQNAHYYSTQVINYATQRKVSVKGAVLLKLKPLMLKIVDEVATLELEQGGLDM